MAHVNHTLGYHPLNTAMNNDLSWQDQAAPPGPCALQQHPRYGATLRAIGVQNGALILRRDGRVRASALIVRRRFGPVTLNWVPRGPVIAADQDSRAIEARLPRLGIVQPEDTAQARRLGTLGWRALMTPQHVAEIDLTRPEPDRLADLHQKWRNRLRAAQGGDLRLSNRPFDPLRDGDLLKREAAQRQARGYRALPEAFTLAYGSCAKGAVRLFMAHDKTELAAFMLVLLHPPVATYHIGWSGPAGRRASAHTLLLWQAGNWLAARGFARFDLGSIDTEHAPGLARFKLGSGARARPIGPSMIRLPAIAAPRVPSWRAA